MLRNGIFGLALGIAACAIPPASAQQSAAPPSQPSQDDAIIVTGQREVTKKQVHRYVRGVTSTVDGQLTRFLDPVCPAVIGFADPYNKIVADRIRQFAASAHVPVAKESCRPNLKLVIAEDADKLVADMRIRAPGAFNGVDSTALERAFRSGPVHAWANTEILNEDGQGVVGGTLYVRSASIIEMPTQQAVIGATIVIDHDATLGKTLRQISDYVAMRALAGARPPRNGLESDTILTLFDQSVTPPPTATRMDQSYLEGLYASRPTARAVNAMGRISGHIRRKDAAAHAGDKEE